MNLPETVIISSTRTAGSTIVKPGATAGLDELLAWNRRKVPISTSIPNRQ